MTSPAVPPATKHSRTWKWTVCGLLLLASAINYMDRQTLANASKRITDEFHLTQTQYGNFEAVFAYAFAAGSIVFGWLADRISVRWLYAIVLTSWSLAGLAAGFVTNAQELLICRGVLGFFEAGHWPCGVRTTRALLDARERSFGNSVLQSGTSIGAIVTPLLMLNLMKSDVLGAWRLPFQIVGLAGLAWLVLWFAFIRAGDLPAPVPPERKEAGDLWSVIFSPRMLVVFFTIASINTTWQILRAWLPKILQEGSGYSERHTLFFNSAWYAFTDVGCLGAGALAVWLARRMTVHRARLLVFAACGLLCATTALTPFLAKGWPLLCVWLLAGAGALGVFPLYHAFTQDISSRHQGRVTGFASAAGWVIPAGAQILFGNLADTTGSFNTGLILAAFLPLLAAVPLWLFWERNSDPIGG